jgi:ATP-dependent protease HslVU (ClpYQ) peptidase subunit
MTVVSAIIDGSVCIFSSDSGSFSEESVSIRNNSKIFGKTIEGAGNCLIGFAGTFAICQWIKFLDFPECPSAMQSLEQYLVRILQPFLAKSLRKRWKKEDGHEAEVDVTDYILLLGIHGCLYTLYSNGDVEKASANTNMYCFASIGSAGQVSNAGMYSIQSCGSNLTSWEILEEGMKNAEKFSLHVRAPFDIKYIF